MHILNLSTQAYEAQELSTSYEPFDLSLLRDLCVSFGVEALFADRLRTYLSSPSSAHLLPMSAAAPLLDTHTCVDVTSITATKQSRNVGTYTAHYSDIFSDGFGIAPFSFQAAFCSPNSPNPVVHPHEDPVSRFI